MPVPTAITDLDPSAAANSPPGTESAKGNIDNYLRAGFAFTRQLYNATVAPAAITIASSSTPAIGAALSSNIIISGTTTITGFDTVADGITRFVTFSGAATLTHNASSLILPGAANITPTAGDCAIFLSLGSGRWRCTNYQSSTLANACSQLSGLTLSTAGSSTSISVAAGQAADSTNAVLLKIASSITKTTSAWAVGTGNGGLDTGSISSSTWYHAYLIQRPDTGVVDVLLSLSASSPTMPTNYTYKRRIGSAKTNGSSQWTTFRQFGDQFLWDVPVGDIAITPVTTEQSVAMSVPTGVVVTALLRGRGSADTTVGASLVVRTPGGSTQAADTPTGNVVLYCAATGTTYTIPNMQIITDTSAQITLRANGAGGVNTYISTYGWIDTRGKDS